MDDTRKELGKWSEGKADATPPSDLRSDALTLANGPIGGAVESRTPVRLLARQCPEPVRQPLKVASHATSEGNSSAPRIRTWIPWRNRPVHCRCARAEQRSDVVIAPREDRNAPWVAFKSRRIVKEPGRCERRVGWETRIRTWIGGFRARCPDRWTIPQEGMWLHDVQLTISDR